MFYTGLTYDDVGGLCYLLSSNNVALENLIPGVRGSGLNTTNYVIRAFRPGVEKITFQRLDYDVGAGQFMAITNQYTDSYVLSNLVQRQILERVIARPDILFSVQFLGGDYVMRTGTSNWVNNGSPFQDGPGVIQPPISICFNASGPGFLHRASYTYPGYLDLAFVNWGSFGPTTDPVIIFPSFSLTNVTTLHLLLDRAAFPAYKHELRADWILSGETNALFLLQTSTNLSDWLTITTITNLGGTFTYIDQSYASSPQRYFRTVTNAAPLP